MKRIKVFEIKRSTKYQTNRILFWIPIWTNRYRWTLSHLDQVITTSVPLQLSVKIMVLDVAIKNTRERSKPIRSDFNLKDFVQPDAPLNFRLYSGNENVTDGVIKISCEANYYGKLCNVFCMSNNSSLGHHTCANDGKPLCIAGWTGTRCETPVCTEDCSWSYYV